MRKCFIIMIALFIFILTSCGSAISKKYEAARNIIEQNLPAYVYDDLDLSAIGAKTGVQVTWKSQNPDVLTDDGHFIDPLENTVTLTAVITIDGKEKSFDFVMETPKLYDKDFTAAWNYFRGRIKSPIGRDLNLANNYLEKCTAAYESDNESILTDAGVITKRAVDQDVTLTTIIKCGDNMRKYDSIVTVSGYSDTERTDMIKAWMPGQLEAYLKGEITKMPSTHPEVGGQISYQSPVIGLIKANGTIIRPVDIINTDVTAEISYGASVTNFTFQLGNFGGVTEKEFLDEWLTNQMPEFFLGSKTTFKPLINTDGVVYDYAFTKQVRTNDYGVINLFTGQDPVIDQELITGQDLRELTYWDENLNAPAARQAVTQDHLDVDMYPGYQIPNDDNILWIVIHESGMPSNGNTATVLSNLMKSKINNTNNSSSWHYSVDEHRIIQSLPDEVIGWHAGGQGTTKYYGYNSNSIGIEMAINGDGNYEGAMHNDAKLVAYLLDKYNLSLQNVKRHYDSFGKICPIIMINTNRYYEFLDMVSTELTARKYLRDATVTWEISDPDLLVPLSNGMYANKPQTEDKTVDFTLTVTKGDYYFHKTFTVKINKSSN